MFRSEKNSSNGMSTKSDEFFRLFTRFWYFPLLVGTPDVYRSYDSFLQKMFHWSLISRRSRFQTGSRFFSRGCDPKGNVSNFCETEQIVEYNGQLASYVQTRGSMPFYWSQRPCIKYMPKPIGTVQFWFISWQFCTLDANLYCKEKIMKNYSNFKTTTLAFMIRYRASPFNGNFM